MPSLNIMTARSILFACLLTVTQLGYGQNSNTAVPGTENKCFYDLMNIGADLLKANDWLRAIATYETARACPDVSATEDSIARAAIEEAYNKQLAALTKARNDALALNTSLSLAQEELKRDSAALRSKNDALVKTQQDLDSALIEMQYFALISEANRLSYRTARETQAARYDSAMQLGLMSVMGIDSLFEDIDSIQNPSLITIRQAFSNAVFGKYSRKVTGLNSYINGVFLHPERDMLYTRLADSTIAIVTYNLNTEKDRSKTFTYQTENPEIQFNDQLVYTIASVSEAPHFVHGNENGVIKFWNPSSDASSASPSTITSHSSLTYVTEAAFHRSGNKFCAGSRDGHLSFYELTGSNVGQLHKTTDEQAHSGAVSGIKYSNDGNLVMTQSFNKSVKVWGHDGSLLNDLTHDHYVYYVDFSENSSVYFTVDLGGNLTVCSNTHECKEYRLYDNGLVTYASKVPGSENLLITANQDGVVLLTNLFDGSTVSRRNIGTGSTDLTISKDGKTLCATNMHDVSFVDISNDRLTRPRSSRHSGLAAVKHIEISSDGKYALAITADSSAVMWHRDGSIAMALPKMNTAIHDIGFTEDGLGFWLFTNDAVWLCPLPDLIYSYKRVLLPNIPDEGFLNHYDVPEQYIEAVFHVEQDE